MEASAAMGELARGLHPAVLSERGLAAALQVLAARAPLPVHLRELPGRRFAAVIETTAYLLVAEAIANAIPTPTRPRHAARADGGNQLTIEFRDNGIGGAAVRPAAAWRRSPTARRRSAGVLARVAARRRHGGPARDPR